MRHNEARFLAPPEQALVVLLVRLKWRQLRATVPMTITDYHDDFDRRGDDIGDPIYHFGSWQSRLSESIMSNIGNSPENSFTLPPAADNPKGEG